MELIEFIRDNIKWEEELATAGIKVVKNGDLALIKYDHIATDFNHPIAEYCRGSIIDLKELKYVCKAFNKFWNLGQYRCAKLDWESAKYMEKLDGSIMKLWFYKGEWRVSSNGVIFAEESDVRENFFDVKSMGDLFWKAWENNGYDLETISKKHTHIFELCTPVNKVVVPHTSFDLYFLGMFENETAEEFFPIEHQFKTFKTFDLGSPEEAMSTALKMPFTEEGYVVVDKYGRRCKIKSLAYISVHRMIDETLKEEALFNIVYLGEEGEVLTYFPELKEKIEKIKYKLNPFMEKIEESLLYIQENFKSKDCTLGRKEMAIYIQKNCPYMPMGFAFLDNHFELKSFREYMIEQFGYGKIKKYL